MHEVRLIPPICVKPFVRRQKNDAADAGAIVEAASRPTMRFVSLKTEKQQARSMIFRTRDLLVRQRTQLVNALRGHLAEHGIAAQSLPKVKVLAAILRETAGGQRPAGAEAGITMLVILRALMSKSLRSTEGSCGSPRTMRHSS